MLIEKTFKSTQTTAQEPTTILCVNLWPDIPQLEMWTEDSKGTRNRLGPSVVFRGEQVGMFIQWLSDPTYKAVG